MYQIIILYILNLYSDVSYMSIKLEGKGAVGFAQASSSSPRPAEMQKESQQSVFQGSGEKKFNVSSYLYPTEPGLFNKLD